MKISASIYSRGKKDLQALVRELDECGVDYLHVDCKDDLRVFEDIAEIRKFSNTPIDLHIISAKPEKYFDLIRDHQIQMVTFQLENLKKTLQFPKGSDTQWGIALVSGTPIEAFKDYQQEADFILFMTTVPGKSGGVFNQENFRRIREFNNRFPSTRVHVDGGVNDEVSFILRNMGVDTVVSGKYLVQADSIARALLHMKLGQTESHYRVGDFMMGLEELPVIPLREATFQRILQTIEDYKLGFCLLIDNNGKLAGLTTNADVRRTLLRHLNDLNAIDIRGMINPNPKVVKENRSVQELLRLVKALNFPVLYLPVINEQFELRGALTFNNLIKGEL